MENKFYRYEIHNYASMSDDYGSISSFSNTKLVLLEYNLHKETDKGYWIGYGNYINGYSFKSQSKWISKTSKKRFAYPTKEEALNNLIRRTERRKKILEHQLDSCIIGLNEANKILVSNKK